MMKQSIITAALRSLPLLLFVGTVHGQTTAAATTTAANLKPIQTLACYKSPEPLVEDQEYQFATDGWCQEQCGNQGHPVMALVAGSTCYCGDEIPPLDQQVALSNCNSPCNGYGTKNCGGVGFWQVYLTGLTTNVGTADNSTSSSSSSSSGTTTASPSVITKAGATVVVTAAPASSSSTTAQNNSTNKVGIAVGVVVGLLAVASLVGSLVFYLKHRRRRAIEEEHKRNAAMNDFIGGKKSETALSTDQRLDPVIFSHRRESIGSIADELDYSRRILQVRNPDHRSSQASAAKVN